MFSSLMLSQDASPGIPARWMTASAPWQTAVIASMSVTDAALASALITFSSQALPRAVRHDLSGATGTSFVIEGNVNASQGAQYTSLLPGKTSAALAGTPFAFYRAYWSDPLGFVAGSRPAAPGNTTVQIVEAATLQAVTAQAALVSGHWPGDPIAGGPIPAALPVTAASLLPVRTVPLPPLRGRK